MTREPVWIEARDVLVLHDRLLALHGGATGLREGALLQSALARPQQLYAYADSPDTVNMAAAYTAAIVRNHAFIEGNLRTGLVVGMLFGVEWLPLHRHGRGHGSGCARVGGWCS